MASVEDIQNFLQLSDQLGSAGQPFRDQFSLIADAGYATVINLAMPDSMDAVADEADLVRGLGMEYASIPVVWEAPLDSDLVEFFALMERQQGRKVFVHCARNMRVSAFLYLYRVLRQGMSSDQAWSDLQRIWVPNETWQAFIQKALAQHQGGHG